MSRGMKIVLIVAGSCVALGVILCVAAVVISGGGVWNMAVGGAAGYEYREYSAPAGAVHTLRLDERNYDVTVLPSEEGGVHICYYEKADKDYYDIELSNGCLTIKREYSRSWTDYIGFSWGQKTDVTVYLPDGVLEDVEIQTSNSRLTAKHVSVLGNLTLESSNGALYAEKLTTGAGLTLSTSNGRIEGHDLYVSGSLCAEASNGRAEFFGVDAADILIETSNGDMELRNCLADGTLEAKTSNSRIDVEGISGRRIVLKTSNGAVGGTVAGSMGDYAITSRTSNGANTLPNGTRGEKTLDVETSNSSIAVYFED